MYLTEHDKCTIIGFEHEECTERRKRYGYDANGEEAEEAKRK